MITSSSSCDFTVTSPDGAVQNRTYQWRQHIVYESCRDDQLSRVAPPSQQLSVDQIFVMFDPENDLIRYAMTAKMGSVHSEFRGDPCVWRRVTSAMEQVGRRVARTSCHTCLRLEDHRKANRNLIPDLFLQLPSERTRRPKVEGSAQIPTS